MSTVPAVEVVYAEVVAAVALAVRAPSIHNTQPWLWHLQGRHLDLRADRSRQLAVADSDSHSLLVSCGAALALTELGLREQGVTTSVERLPDPADLALLARFHLNGRAVVAARDTALARAARDRRSERRPFGPARVDPTEVRRLADAGAGDGVWVHVPHRQDELTALAVAVSHADRVEREDPAYLAEIGAWVHAGSVPDGDGVPSSVVPHVTTTSPRHTDVPLRDFELGTTGTQLIASGVDEHPLLAVVLTEGDTALDRLRAGEAMMRLMLEAEIAGLASCALSQAVDMPVFRSRLSMLMGWMSCAQMMVRIGPRPPGTPAALTGRRPLQDVLRAVH